MQKFWQISLTLTAIYGAVVVGMSAAISHLFLHSLDGKALSSLLSSTALLAFQTLALLALSLWQLAIAQQQTAQTETAGSLKILPALVAAGFHLGLWLFVYTVWAGLLNLPLHFSQLAPLGGQLLLLCWLLLAATAWIRK
ncbi:hypothetical protein [Rheinheimera sp. 4Y26]|uniref:hypothetical protein n=1 Tax=Rheinheimera sp. 4Y26 TaxID=2977811 RepID=UPI0021B090D1|nr:hypothetical protein [Rheinheimera sp. 4Y26]MCT6700330.1 hypothetical protein [Rheinheimera sp. 4Y26]